MAMDSADGYIVTMFDEQQTVKIQLGSKCGRSCMRHQQVLQVPHAW
eukprot:CAMPEP_0202862100 /NCGR_PEP_ID=MMETSP1391-20130828/3265_1 /ASSEMBLY_ACC=CAM_ASM_000867 /TAXON_ID=1034604 /ORGANISM="Chlamydomonas leiostraca, Strain SAG 11-49" /LENGTH=45 /DNA_ID= /DNA_START= /DNA_END= /DNA_ORIENTATION=